MLLQVFWRHLQKVGPFDQQYEPWRCVYQTFAASQALLRWLCAVLIRLFQGDQQQLQPDLHPGQPHLHLSLRQQRWFHVFCALHRKQREQQPASVSWKAFAVARCDLSCPQLHKLAADVCQAEIVIARSVCEWNSQAS